MSKNTDRRRRKEKKRDKKIKNDREVKKAEGKKGLSEKQRRLGRIQIMIVISLAIIGSAAIIIGISS